VGQHVLPWNGFRIFGPVASGRYDPHLPPASDQPGRGVLYLALDVATVVAEAFQLNRRVDTSTGGPYLTSWIPTRTLTLLDLSGDWALRNGAANALTAAPRPTCRSWSRAIHETWPELDGLWAPSTMTGSPMVTLYETARSVIPPTPEFSRPLNHPMVWSVVEASAARIGYDLR
jgi:hypothetical protein